MGCFPFARRYLGNHCCFLFLRVLRCFSSPGSPRTPMYSVHDDTGLAVPGSPIQKSPDHSLFSDSPRLIAAYHVFHRRLAPRHPPSALSSLTTTLWAERFNASTLLSHLIVKEPRGITTLIPLPVPAGLSPSAETLPQMKIRIRNQKQLVSGLLSLDWWR